MTHSSCYEDRGYIKIAFTVTLLVALSFNDGDMWVDRIGRCSKFQVRNAPTPKKIIGNKSTNV